MVKRYRGTEVRLWGWSLGFLEIVGDVCVVFLKDLWGCLGFWGKQGGAGRRQRRRPALPGVPKTANIPKNPPKNRKHPQKSPEIPTASLKSLDFALSRPGHGLQAGDVLVVHRSNFYMK